MMILHRNLESSPVLPELGPPDDAPDVATNQGKQKPVRNSYKRVRRGPDVANDLIARVISEADSHSVESKRFRRRSVDPEAVAAKFEADQSGGPRDAGRHIHVAHPAIGEREVP